MQIPLTLWVPIPGFYDPHCEGVISFCLIRVSLYPLLWSKCFIQLERGVPLCTLRVCAVSHPDLPLPCTRSAASGTLSVGQVSCPSLFFSCSCWIFFQFYWADSSSEKGTQALYPSPGQWEWVTECGSGLVGQNCCFCGLWAVNSVHPGKREGPPTLPSFSIRLVILSWQGVCYRFILHVCLKSQVPPIERFSLESFLPNACSFCN